MGMCHWFDSPNKPTKYGPLLLLAKKLKVPQISSYHSKNAKPNLVEAILKRMKEIADEVVRQVADDARFPPSYENLTKILQVPQHNSLELGELNPFMTEKWHLCFCYAQFLWALQPDSVGRFCEDHFEIVLQLGASVTIIPAVTAILSNIEEVTFRTEKCMRFSELAKLPAFRKKIQGYHEDEEKSFWKVSFNTNVKLGLNPTFLLLNCIENLFDKGLITNMPNAAPGYTRQIIGSNTSNQTLRDQLNDSLKDDNIGNLPNEALLLLLQGGSSILTHVFANSSADLFNNFIGPSAKGIVVHNLQGIDLTSNQFVFAMYVENEKFPIFFSTDHRYFFQNNDRWSEKLLLKDFFNAFVCNREGNGLIRHAVNHRPKENARAEIGCAINAIALLRLDNFYREEHNMEPLKLRLLKDHPALHDAKNAEERIERRMALLRKEIKDGVWKMSDIHRGGIIENAFSGLQAPWLVCTKILHYIAGGGGDGEGMA
ncbi:hypothetical protein TrCOL_g9540 [Triparma columacea]|uniref:Uncharacterized protein n=1 Tax=Triparma columacea TaxID=722753 RepID=A0A9W7L7U7_9STRA|nr:hypothetical protein TrCOL_g9540 [Triparma columacea]